MRSHKGHNLTQGITPGMSDASVGWDVSNEAVELGNAVARYERDHHRRGKMEAWEVLLVIRSLGYTKSKVNYQTEDA